MRETQNAQYVAVTVSLCSSGDVLKIYHSHNNKIESLNLKIWVLKNEKLEKEKKGKGLNW